MESAGIRGEAVLPQRARFCGLFASSLLMAAIWIHPAAAQIDCGERQLVNPLPTEINPDLTDLGDHVWAIPAAATSTGIAGTLWISDVVIHNSDEFDAPAYLVHLPRIGQGEPTRGECLTIPARRSLHLEDALAHFGEDATGALLVVSDRPLQVISRVFNDQPEGTYGQFINGTPVVEALGVGQEGILIQLTENEDFRTNLALANPLPDGVSVQVAVSTVGGERLGTTAYFVPGLSSYFETRFLRRHTTEPVSDAFAVIRPVSSAGRVVALASVVDAHTGDPMTQPAQEDRSRYRVASIGQPPVLQHNDWNDLAFAHEKWLAAGEDGLAVSRDGVHWELAVDLSPSWDDILGLAFNGSRIVAFGCGTTLWTSDDGESWASHDTQDLCLVSVTWDGTKWFGVKGGFRDSIATSTNGVNWQTHVIQGASLRGAIRGGDRYVGWTDDGAAHSVDGISWESVDLGGRLSKVVWNGEWYLGIGSDFLALSSDGVNWDVRSSSRDLFDILWAGDRWVAGTSSPGESSDHSPGFIVSADGTYWEDIAQPGRDMPVMRIAWDGTAVFGLDIYRWTVFLIGDTMTVTVPAAAHVNGHEGARWRSDLELHNPHDDPVVCAIDLLERDTGNLWPLSRTATVEGSGSVRLVDVVASTFGTEGAGALRITPNESTILVSSRTYDDADDGSYGQHVPGFRASDAVWDFEAGRIIGLAHSPNPSAGFRTNIGLVSDCARSMEVEVELFDGDGEHLGTASSRLWSFGVRQLNHIFRPFTDDVVTNGHTIVRTLTPQCSFYAYASVVDNRTNDPTLIPAVPYQ